MARMSGYHSKRDELLEALERLTRVYGRPPSLRDLAASVDVGVATVSQYVRRMREEGLVEFPDQRHRAIRIVQHHFEQQSSEAS